MCPVNPGSHATFAKDHAQAALRLNGQIGPGLLLVNPTAAPGSNSLTGPG
jgi:hypothetical protein